ncbi:MAG: SDR family oxidoreductase [Pseudomonadota bacterium]
MVEANAVYPDLRDRSVFVSGGATGIGEALVRAFAAQGSRTAFVDIDVQAGQALAAELGDAVHFAPCDITDTPAYQAAIRAAADRFGPVTALINNAANDLRHSLEDLTPQRFDELVAVNLKHSLFAAQAVAPMMRAAGGGSIVNFGSISWMIPQGNFPSYATSKAGIHGMTRTLAKDLGPDGVRVNTVVPGWVMTEKQRRLWLDEAGKRAIAENQLLQSPLMPEHIARMVLFLASDASAMCTAQNFTVDGGWT